VQRPRPSDGLTTPHTLRPRPCTRQKPFRGQIGGKHVPEPANRPSQIPFADILRTQIKGRSQAAALSARNSLIFRANLARPKRFELLTPRFVVVQWSVRRLRPAVRLKHRCQACGQFSGCRHPAFEACELQLVVSAHRAVVVPASCPAPLHVQDRRERAF
jgi:hypothetical protein